MSLALAELAEDVGTSERTLRRAVSGGLIRAPRDGSSGSVLTDSEAEWVRRHWALIGQLKAILRTEPNVELAVLFGSVARGEELAGTSDLDLLVGLRKPLPGALDALRQRLGRRLDVEMQLVPLEGALRNPRLLGEVLRDGRPVVDRADAWVTLRTQARSAAARARRDVLQSRARALAALDYFRELAAARAAAPLSTGS